MNGPELSLVIVNWNTREPLLRCLASLRAAGRECALEVIVVDNGSTDHSVEAVAADWPEAVLIRNPDNRGFAAAANQGLRWAHAPFLGLLNPDAEVLPGALTELLAAFQDQPQVWAVGPQLLNSDDSLQASGRRFPSLLRFWAAGIFPAAWQRSPGWQRWVFGRTDFSRPTLVDEVSGACFIARREAWERLGWLNEAYFLYFEEVDWFRRLATAGKTVAYVPSAWVRHAGGASADQNQGASRLENFRSVLIYFRTHHGLGAELAARFIALTQLAVWSLRAAVRRLLGRASSSNESRPAYARALAIILGFDIRRS
jgi:GT2 family glycosyltransferase